MEETYTKIDSETLEKKIVQQIKKDELLERKRIITERLVVIRANIKNGLVKELDKINEQLLLLETK